MSGSTFQPTAEQLAAIHEVGGSVLVSAAAGSGKTAVLAERCAHLVCDAPREQRCELDQLLVLTFTEAAAAEMRGRIIDCIRVRLENAPTDRRLREQMALANAAHIATIHSFCLWLIRRWFTEAKVDAAATVMDAEEAALLRREVLGRILDRLYSFAVKPDDPLGTASLSPRQEPPAEWAAEDWILGKRDEPALARAFLHLVDVYGLGSDWEIVSFVLRLYDFTTSLPDWRSWLTQAAQAPALRPQEVMNRVFQELRTEVGKHLEHIEQGIDRLASASGSTGYLPQVVHYRDSLKSWARALDGASASALFAAYDLVREGIEQFEFPRAGSSPRVKNSDQGGKEAAAAFAAEVRGMFRDRLRRRFGHFAVGEWLEGLRQTAPFIATICDLVAALHREYTTEKRRLGVLDFADLERLAFDLLTDSLAAKGVAGGPSPIARELHRKFVQVLVDEFQDINPLQEAILRLASRQAAPESTDNLFAVGDIKQSIYRFRLAEPSIFAERLGVFRKASLDKRRRSGKALFLQRNFRSRPELLDAVNFVFGTLMNGAGGIAYDEQAVLRPGRNLKDTAPGEPVELHVIERTITATTGDSELEDGDEGTGGAADEPNERRVADYANPANWTPIEREAFLIGRRILELTTGPREGLAPLARADIGPTSEETARPWKYRDMAILLRATKVNAERMAAMLSAMGIPAHAEVGGSLFATREAQDVVSALRVLDNMQQDIPLAAVLRSGIFGEQLTADELVEIRLLDPRAAFHDAVRRFARRSALEASNVRPAAANFGLSREKDAPGTCCADSDLQARLSDLLKRIERYRERARRRPLSETLWAIYEDEGFLAHCAGLPNGAQRRANLIKLHDLARKFDSFRLQGLHRFLKFLESLEDERREVDVAPSVGEADNVVRIMSVHQSKGLEFPVVFVAGLGNAFNLGDRRGRMIFEREARIGLKVVDTEKMIDYPSASHRLASMEVERTSREEEMRILYVAMTRARDKLVLVGSRPEADSLHTIGTPASAHGWSSPYSIGTASCPLDWLLPLLHESPNKVHVHREGAEIESKAEKLFTLTLHNQAQVETWRAAEPASTEEQKLRAAVAKLDALPPDEPLAAEAEEVQETLERLGFTYPHLATTSVRATLSASGYKDAGELEEISASQRAGRNFTPYAFVIPPTKYAPRPADEPTRRGTVTHRVLQHLDFEKAAQAGGLASELQRLVLRGALTEQEVGVLDQGALVWFLGTPIADRIRAAGEEYRRELRFVTTELVSDVDPSTVATEEDRVLVRGIMDGIIVQADGLEVIDFKTDAVTAEELQERAALYYPQMEAYARAGARLWKRPVQSCHLVFLTPRVILSREYAAGMDRERSPMTPAACQQVFPWMSP